MSSSPSAPHRPRPHDNDLVSPNTRPYHSPRRTIMPEPSHPQTGRASKQPRPRHEHGVGLASQSKHACGLPGPAHPHTDRRSNAATTLPNAKSRQSAHKLFIRTLTRYLRR